MFVAVGKSLLRFRDTTVYLPRIVFSALAGKLLLSCRGEGLLGKLVSFGEAKEFSSLLGASSSRCAFRAHSLVQLGEQSIHALVQINIRVSGMM